MSFADEVRAELYAIPVKKPCCRRALAAGLLLTGGLRLLGDGGGNFTLLLAALWLLAGMLQRRFPKRKGQKSGRKRDFL